MKSIILILMCCLVTATMLNGQLNQLVLTNTSNGHERFLEPGKKIRIYKTRFNKIKGKLTIIDSTTIAIGIDTIALIDIVTITAITKGSRSAGVLLVTIGGLVLAGGIVGLEEAISQSGGGSFGPSEESFIGLTSIVTLIGASITSVGIGKLVVGSPYKSNKWVYSIR